MLLRVEILWQLSWLKNTEEDLDMPLQMLPVLLILKYLLLVEEFLKLVIY